MSEKKYLKDTQLIKNSPDNTGILPSKRDYLTGNRKQAINPLYTVLNDTFTPKGMQKLKNQKEKINISYIEENQEGIIKAYRGFYGEDWRKILQQEIEESKGFNIAKGLKSYDEKSTRSIHISLEEWEHYQKRNGYKDHVFNCEARPDILILDFDYELTEDQLHKIEKNFKKYLWIIEQNTKKGTSHIYLQCDDNNTITSVKTGLKKNKEDEKPLDIDIFKGRKGYVCGASPSRPYKILYDETPTSSISTRKAITKLSETLNYHLDKEALEEILQQRTQQHKTTTTKATRTGEITITTNSEFANQRAVTIVENAIPIFQKLAGNGIREELYKSLGGALLQNGFNNKDMCQIMTNIYNNTDDKDPRLTTVKNTIDRYQSGEIITGWTTFRRVVEENKGEHRITAKLQRIADTILINKIPVIKTLNPQTEQLETSVFLGDGTVTTLINDENQQYTDLEETSENNETVYTISNPYNDYKIIVDYKHKNIARTTLKTDKKGNVTKEDTLIITAVPEDLEVYNDTISSTGKQYKCKWTFEDGTITEITGDIILHQKTLNTGAGVWKKSLLQDTISAVFGDLTRTQAHGTKVKNTPIKKGFYYDKSKEEIIVVDHEIERPTKEKLLEALQLLDVYSSFFGYYYYNPKGQEFVDYIPKEKIDGAENDGAVFRTDPTRLAVFIRWCLNAPFHYVRKQMGMTNDQYIFLSGESGVGKTFGYIVAGGYIIGIDNPKEELIMSGGSNSKAQISGNMSKTTFPIFIDEGDAVFNKEDLTSLLKHGLQNLYSREVTDKDTGQLVKYPALSSLGFSANNIFKDTEKGGLTNRVIILPFYTRDILTIARKKRFMEEFNTHYLPEDKRHVLKWIGYEFQARIIENPKIYINKNQDQIVKDFFTDICHEVGFLTILDWINKDLPFKTADEELLERHNELCDIIVTLLNKEMKFLSFKHDPESYTETKLIDTTLSPKEKILTLAESCKVSWLRTNKSKTHLFIKNGVIRAIHKEDKQININDLEEFRDLLLNGRYEAHNVGRYSINENGESKQSRVLLKVDIEAISDLYELED